MWSITFLTSKIPNFPPVSYGIIILSDTPNKLRQEAILYFRPYHVSKDDNIFNGISLQHWMKINWRKKDINIKLNWIFKIKDLQSGNLTSYSKSSSTSISINMKDEKFRIPKYGTKILKIYTSQTEFRPMTTQHRPGLLSHGETPCELSCVHIKGETWLEYELLVAALFTSDVDFKHVSCMVA